MKFPIFLLLLLGSSIVLIYVLPSYVFKAQVERSAFSSYKRARPSFSVVSLYASPAAHQLLPSRAKASRPSRTYLRHKQLRNRQPWQHDLLSSTAAAIGLLASLLYAKHYTASPLGPKPLSQNPILCKSILPAPSSQRVLPSNKPCMLFQRYASDQTVAQDSIYIACALHGLIPQQQLRPAVEQILLAHHSKTRYMQTKALKALTKLTAARYSNNSDLEQDAGLDFVLKRKQKSSHARLMANLVVTLRPRTPTQLKQLKLLEHKRKTNPTKRMRYTYRYAKRAQHIPYAHRGHRSTTILQADQRKAQARARLQHVHSRHLSHKAKKLAHSHLKLTFKAPKEQLAPSIQPHPSPKLDQAVRPCRPITWEKEPKPPVEEYTLPPQPQICFQVPTIPKTVRVIPPKKLLALKKIGLDLQPDLPMCSTLRTDEQLLDLFSDFFPKTGAADAFLFQLKAKHIPELRQFPPFKRLTWLDVVQIQRQRKAQYDPAYHNSPDPPSFVVTPKLAKYTSWQGMMKHRELISFVLSLWQDGCCFSLLLDQDTLKGYQYKLSLLPWKEQDASLLHKTWVSVKNLSYFHLPTAIRDQVGAPLDHIACKLARMLAQGQPKGHIMLQHPLFHGLRASLLDFKEIIPIYESISSDQAMQASACSKFDLVFYNQQLHWLQKVAYGIQQTMQLTDTSISAYRYVSSFLYHVPQSLKKEWEVVKKEVLQRLKSNWQQGMVFFIFIELVIASLNIMHELVSSPNDTEKPYKIFFPRLMNLLSIKIIELATTHVQSYAYHISWSVVYRTMNATDQTQQKERRKLANILKSLIELGVQCNQTIPPVDFIINLVSEAKIKASQSQIRAVYKQLLSTACVDTQVL